MSTLRRRSMMAKMGELPPGYTKIDHVDGKDITIENTRKGYVDFWQCEFLLKSAPPKSWNYYYVIDAQSGQNSQPEIARNTCGVYRNPNAYNNGTIIFQSSNKSTVNGLAVKLNVWYKVTYKSGEVTLEAEGNIYKYTTKFVTTEGIWKTARCCGVYFMLKDFTLSGYDYLACTNSEGIEGFYNKKTKKFYS